MIEHIFYISSWYPRVQKSEGTFIENQLLALKEQGIRCAIMHTEEVTALNFIKAIISGKEIITHRNHPNIMAVKNVVVHKLPLRFNSNPLAVRKQYILKCAIRKMKTYIKVHGRPNVLFHHGIFDYTYITQAISEYFQIPYFFMEHSSLIDTLRPIPDKPFHSGTEVRSFVEKAQRRITVTHHYVRVFSEYFGAPFSYCPNVLTSDFFPSSINRDALHIAPFRFLNIGLLEPHKNQELLIRAFALKYAGNPSFTLTIAGDGSLGPSLQKLSEELGVASQVSITGFLSRKGIKELLTNCHVFVLSSTSETFAVVLAEAMAFGMPVLAPNIGGPAELIEPEVGHTFIPGSVEDLGEKMSTINLRYPAMNRKRIAERCFANFSSSTFVKYLLDE